MRLVDVSKHSKVNLRSLSAQFLQIGGLIVKRSLKNPTKILMHVKSLYLKASKPKLGAIWRIPIARGSISVVPINFRIREFLSTDHLEYA